jgi:hypothetical protein
MISTLNELLPLLEKIAHIGKFLPIIAEKVAIRGEAAAEAEMKELKARVEDAQNATRATIRGGIVPGGGIALLYPFPKHLKECSPIQFCTRSFPRTDEIGPALGFCLSHLDPWLPR